MNILNTLQQYKRNHSNEEGFTLIELMIVVVIIGILAAIAIPIFANQQKEAVLSSAKSDLKNAALSVTTYTTKTNGKLPTTCAAVREMMESMPVTPGNEVRYLYSQTTPGVYFIRTHSLDPAFKNAARDDVADEYRMFYLSEAGKTFYGKDALGTYLSRQGTNIVSWLASHNFVNTTKSVNGISPCATSNE